MRSVRYLMVIILGLFFIPLAIHFVETARERTVEVGDLYFGGIITYFLEPTDEGYDPNKKMAIVVNVTAISVSQWGCRGGLVGNNPENSGTSTDFGTGLQNTLNIIESHDAWDAIGGVTCHVNWDGTVAAKNAKINGYFLPSRDELIVIYNNREVIDINTGLFWSSSEVDAWEAYAVNFTNGQVNDTHKTVEKNVMPVMITNVQPPEQAILNITPLFPLLIGAIVLTGVAMYFKKGY